MFFTSKNDEELFKSFESIGLRHEIKNNKDVLIKINLASTYRQNHPRTDMTLLRTVINYIYQSGGRCAIAEGANGHLKNNLVISGLDDIINKYEIKIIDTDFEECEEVLSCGERHYIPKVFRSYSVKIAIPATSKRKDMLYSSNIKLFVGAVPRSLYQLEDAVVSWRPRIHQNLDFSVASLFLAVEEYSRFQFYINGGLSFNENIGEFNLTETFIGNDAFELDFHLYKTFFHDCEYPEYLKIIKEKLSNDTLRL